MGCHTQWLKPKEPFDQMLQQRGGRIQTVNFAGVLSACASATQHLKNTCILMNMNLVDNVFDCGEL